MEEIRNNARISVFWDIQRCPVPRDVETKDVSGNLFKVLQDNMFDGEVDLMWAYGDFSKIYVSVAEDLDLSGMKLIHAPHGTKKLIENDLAPFSLGNRSPAVIMLISDSDFSNTLHLLGQYEHTIIFVTRSGDEALRDACSYVWDWSDVAHGYSGRNMEVNLFVHQPKLYVKNHETYMQVNSLVSSSTSMSGSSFELESWSDDDYTRYEPGNLSNLRERLVEVLEACNGHVPYGRLNSEFLTKFGKPICVSDYGASDLEDLLRLSDVVQIADQMEGQQWYTRCVSLKEPKTLCGLELCSRELVTWSIRDATPAQLGNLMAFRKHLVELLEACGGHLPYGRISGEFEKRFKRPLCLSDYGTKTLQCLLVATDVVDMEPETLGQDGSWRCVSLN